MAVIQGAGLFPVPVLRFNPVVIATGSNAPPPIAPLTPAQRAALAGGKSIAPAPAPATIPIPGGYKLGPIIKISPPIGVGVAAPTPTAPPIAPIPIPPGVVSASGGVDNLAQEPAPAPVAAAPPPQAAAPAAAATALSTNAKIGIGAGLAAGAVAALTLLRKVL